MAPVISIVAPAYNEERNVPAFLAAIVPVLEGLGESFEIVFVDDGSRDGTLGMLAAAASQDPRIKVVGLSRNFGKDVALSAGLAHATGQAVIPIDCDLQHPVGLIPQFVGKWREGYDMVVGVRTNRDEEGVLRRTASRAYYRMMKMITSVEIPPNAGDFRLIDRKILDVINTMPERHRFMKGIFAWPGFKVASIEFQANVRANETRSSWSFFKLWRFALDGLFSFSTAPLKIWTYVGLLSAFGSFLYLAITLVQKVFFGIDVPGYASLLVLLLLFNGLTMISNGIQGEYIARIFEEVKGRPLYVVGTRLGFDGAAHDAAARAHLTASVPPPAMFTPGDAAPLLRVPTGPRARSAPPFMHMPSEASAPSAPDAPPPYARPPSAPYARPPSAPPYARPPSAPPYARPPSAPPDGVPSSAPSEGVPMIADSAATVPTAPSAPAPLPSVLSAEAPSEPRTETKKHALPPPKTSRAPREAP